MKGLLRFFKQKVTRGVNILPLSSKIIGTPRKCSTSVTYLKQHPEINVHQLAKEEALSLHLPVLNKESFLSFFLFKRKTKDVSVLCLKNARVWGEYGAVVTSDDVFLSDVSREFRLINPCQDHAIFHNIMLNRSIPVSGSVAVIATAGPDTFYHWMLDILPRILFLKEAGIFEKIDKFVLNNSSLPYHRQTLELLGIGEHQILNCFKNRDFHIEAEQLYVPSLPSNLNEVNAYECRLLKKYLLPEFGQIATHKRIYITRRITNTRTVLEEEKLMSYLRNYGFIMIEPEVLSFKEQMEIFNSADIIIGPHGSAFTNIIFCKPGTVLLELVPDTYLITCFYNIAAQLGVKYYGFIGKGMPIDENKKIDNIRVDLQEFSNFFEKNILK